MDFIKKIFSKDYLPVTLAVIIFLLVVFNINTCQRLKQEQQSHENTIMIHENNLKALNDTLKVYFDEVLNATVSEKTAYIVQNIEDLKKYNEELFNEFKNINGLIAGFSGEVRVQLSDIENKLDGQVNEDPTDETYRELPWYFNYSDDGFKYNVTGFSSFRLVDCEIIDPRSRLVSSDFSIDVKYSLTETSDGYIVSAYTKSPLVSFNNIDGVVNINKTKSDCITSRWGFGPSIGFGLNTDVVGKESRFGWHIGFGVTYSIFNF